MKNQKPSDEAIEAALLYTQTDTRLRSTTAADRNLIWSHLPHDHRATGPALAYGANRILAAALHHERCELGHANDLLNQIQALVDGHGVGLRDDVRDVLKKRGA